MAGGIVITASHNPTEWNGLKFIDSDGCFLNGEKNNRLFEIADSQIFNLLQNGSVMQKEHCYNAHIEHTLNLYKNVLELDSPDLFKDTTENSINIDNEYH